MILRRISDAFRKQDWFTVAVETLIVVFGVFIGLQVNNWNEARASRGAEAELRMTLLQDFTELETQLSDRIQAFIGHEEDISELLDIVRADVPPPDVEAMFALLNAAWTLPVLPSPPASYAEIIAAGRLSMLSDPELRRALSRYGQAVDLYETVLPLFRETTTGRDSRIIQAIQINNDLEIVRTDSDAGIEGYDWEILQNADADVQMVLVFMVSGELLAQRQLDEVETILELLRKDGP